MNLLALAIAPGIAICLFIFHKDAYNREPKLNLILTFLFGVISIIPAGFIELYISNDKQNGIFSIAIRAFFLVALIEELVKYAVLRLYAYPKKSFDEPLDGIVYGVVASMGFATAENILYIYQANETGNGVSVAILRMFLAVPAHATFGVIMGYFAGKAKFAAKNKSSLLVQGLIWSIVFHGAYDFFLFLQKSPDIINHDTADILLFLGAVASLIVGIRLSLKHIKTHRHLSQQTFQPTAKLSIRRASLSDIPLIRNLAERIWPATYESILPKEQIDYMMNLMYSESALQKDMQNNIDFILLLDSNVPVGFAAYGWIAQGICKLHKIYVLREMQGKGMGAFIINEIITRLHIAGASALQLNVNRNNIAKGFYEKLGFTVIREEDIDIGGGYFMNDYVMEKPIA